VYKLPVITWLVCCNRMLFTEHYSKTVQQGLVLRRFVLRRFTFTTLVWWDRALPIFGASLSQLEQRLTAGSRFATVRFTTIHFYDTCLMGPSTPDLWCVTVATRAKTYSRVSFCDGSFYDDSLLRHLSNRTEHSRFMVRHCRNSSEDCTAGSRFATVRFTIHFYDTCPIGPSTPDLWCVTVATRASFLYLVRSLNIILRLYSRVSFCDGSFYDDSLLRQLSYRT